MEKCEFYGKTTTQGKGKLFCTIEKCPYNNLRLDAKIESLDRSFQYCQSNGFKESPKDLSKILKPTIFPKPKKEFTPIKYIYSQEENSSISNALDMLEDIHKK